MIKKENFKKGNLVYFIYPSLDNPDHTELNIGIIDSIGKFSMQLRDVITNITNSSLYNPSINQHFETRQYSLPKVEEKEITDDLTKRYKEFLTKIKPIQ